MKEVILKHIDIAWNGGQLQPTATVFAPKDKNGMGPRMVSDQYFRYAGWVDKKTGEILGDPANVGLTRLCQNLGWGIPPEDRTRFDPLPIVFQTPNQMYHYVEIPEDKQHRIKFVHPEYPFFEEMELEWFAIPAVATMRLDFGGLMFHMLPFNGWFLSYEMATLNLPLRYKVLPEIAARMGYDTSPEADPYWEDMALTALHRACIFGFAIRGATIMTHHNVSHDFMDFVEEEKKIRGYVTGNWKWVVPPSNPGVTPIYFGGRF